MSYNGFILSIMEKFEYFFYGILPYLSVENTHMECNIAHYTAEVQLE